MTATENKKTQTSKTYKVWVQIEEINEEEGHYEDVGLPDSLAEYDTLEAAQAFVRSLPGWDRHADSSDNRLRSPDDE